MFSLFTVAGQSTQVIKKGRVRKQLISTLHDSHLRENGRKGTIYMSFFGVD